jgi:hypothetical protein
LMAAGKKHDKRDEWKQHPEEQCLNFTLWLHSRTRQRVPSVQGLVIA